MMNSKTKTLIISILGVAALLLCVAPAAWGATSSKQPFTVVIDAGHGGKDPGSQDNGVNEKDINLAVALKLGDFITKNLKNVKVVYTRQKDQYLTLQQRADVANKAGGNLFISIHVNSADASNPKRTSAAGASTHVIGQSKDRKNADVVRRENSVIKLEKDYAERYQGFNPDSDESYIIFEMMQKRFQERSLDLAQEIQKQLKDVAGRKDRGVTQEPFWVLWSTSMPAVLVELDFICNPNSAKYLASTQGQNKLAKAIFNAVRIYYNQEQTLASQPVMQQEEPSPEPGITYVGDGYAIIGSTPSPERTVTSLTVPTRITRRDKGSKRRSLSARKTSISAVKEQPTVTVRTHPAPADIADSRRTQAQVAATQKAEQQPTQSPKQSGTKKKSTAKNSAKHSKTAKANRKRGQQTMTVSIPAQTKTATNTQPVQQQSTTAKARKQPASNSKQTSHKAESQQTAATTDQQQTQNPATSAAHTKKAHLNRNRN